MNARFAASLAVFRFSLLSAIVLFPTQSASPQAGNVPSPNPIPPALANAKTVFLSNGAADGGLFPEPFSGDPNRAYFTLFSHLKAAARYDLVSDPSQADLVMEITLVAPAGPRTPGKQLGAADPLPFFKLVIYDAKTRFVLWTITEPIELALLQKTHDHNFDQALSNVADDILALSQPNPNPAGLYPHPPARLKGWH